VTDGERKMRERVASILANIAEGVRDGRLSGFDMRWELGREMDGFLKSSTPIDARAIVHDVPGGGNHEALMTCARCSTVLSTSIHEGDAGKLERAAVEAGWGVTGGQGVVVSVPVCGECATEADRERLRYLARNEMA
jgi:hypothetical protein